MAVRKQEAVKGFEAKKLAAVFTAFVALPCIGFGYKAGWFDALYTQPSTAQENQSPLTVQYAYFSPPQVRMPAELPTVIDGGLDDQPVGEPTTLSSLFLPGSEVQRLTRQAQLHAKTRSEYIPGTLPETPVFAPESPLASDSTTADEVVSPEATRQSDSQQQPPSRVERTEAGTQVATITVQPGDNFTAIATGLGIGNTDIGSLLNLEDVKKKLNRLVPGDNLVFELNDNNDLLALSFEVDRENRLRATMQDGAFVARKESLGFEKRLMQAAGHVENSIFLAASAAGVSDALIMEMAEIFRWDVDFAMDIQPGDTFKIVYEGLFDGDQLKRTGRVVGVELTSRQKTHQAFYYKREGYKGAYYTAEGRSLEKQFLRNPLEVVRITSPFDLSRRHPVLNTIRAHKGVDYGAATGTPIFATGRGNVAFIGGRGGYGKTVILQHERKYSTLYAHMSRFRKGLKLGDRVEQGQIIGHVGKTGLATGPHLHYEFRIDGKHTDPQTVDFPGAESLPKSEYANFQQQSQQARFALNAMRLPTVALSD